MYKIGQKIKVYLSDTRTESLYTFGVVCEVMDGVPVLEFKDLSAENISCFYKLLENRYVKWKPRRPGWADYKIFRSHLTKGESNISSESLPKSKYTNDSNPKIYTIPKSHARKF
ncbi:hypothetical protein SAMN04515674_101505 [Pseudarcicella hirudinis]|uniref:Uncharacterized protein n=1 Tax=Pseudarcicella hirudinis TaxID=1079859 RepID=A0A1I5MY20_9BACT|nr:hypothetical protein [Pseudarcicella hirudinis]SFP14434.1 hypothetical protein SAMN04515674_101505 [Pseudarcicella hirudinis]